MKHIINITDDSKIDKVLSVSIPVFIRENDLPVGIATCIILEISGEYFLITASHVFKRYNNFYLPKNIGGFFPEGVLRFIHLKDTKPGSKSDKVDIAILKLENDIDEIKKIFQTITPSDIFFNHEPNFEKKYLLLGYPHRKIKINNINKQITAHSLIYYLEIFKNSNILKKSGHIPELTIPVKYLKKTESTDSDNRVFAPEPEGVSGGGLWALVDLGKNNIQYMLVGIFIEYHKSLSLGIVTKIDLIFNTILREFNYNFVNI